MKTQYSSLVFSLVVVTQRDGYSSTVTAFSAVSTFAYSIPRKSRTLPLWMGLYDDPIPELPTDHLKNRVTRENIREKRRKFVNKNDYLAEEKDEFGVVISSESSMDDDDDEEEKQDRKILFQLDDWGTEANNLIPPMERNLKLGIGCFFEEGDKKVLLVMDKTECHPQDACWALEAHEGSIVDAVISISIAQRKALDDSVALPGADDVKNTDWDGELKILLSGKGTTTASGDLGEEFENSGRSIGFDGLEDRKDQMRRRAMKEGVKRMLEPGQKDQKWLPSENPNPVDDEPWFTG